MTPEDIEAKLKELGGIYLRLFSDPPPTVERKCRGKLLSLYPACCCMSIFAEL